MANKLLVVNQEVCKLLILYTYLLSFTVYVRYFVGTVDGINFFALCIFQVLRLEKWIDTDLRYLRDAADDAYCTIDPNMLPEAPLPTTEELPIFKVPVKNIS